MCIHVCIGWVRPQNSELLCVEDPFDRNIDLGVKVFHIMEIRQAFARAFDKLFNPEKNNLSLVFPNEFLANRTNNKSNAINDSGAPHDDVSAVINPNTSIHTHTHTHTHTNTHTHTHVHTHTLTHTHSIDMRVTYAC